MKTLLLTSAGTQVKEEILKILPQAPKYVKLAHIITASNVEEDKHYIQEDKEALLAMGLQIEDIDLVGKRPMELRRLLADQDVIYVQGGNTFY